MAEFGKSSTRKLLTAHPDLQRVFREVVKHFDCAVICGNRNAAAQNLAFTSGKSKASYGNSPHNFSPALAVDVIPYPLAWHDSERMIYFAGVVVATGRAMGIELKWGGDWNRDTHLSDNRFDDFPHFELVGWRNIKDATK